MLQLSRLPQSSPLRHLLYCSLAHSLACLPVCLQRPKMLIPSKKSEEIAPISLIAYHALSLSRRSNPLGNPVRIQITTPAPFARCESCCCIPFSTDNHSIFYTPEQRRGICAQKGECLTPVYKTKRSHSLCSTQPCAFKNHG
ncbi:hypothetical protein BX070DRAFT_31846 [Coemansia spiralis]|nr:hypothetical protein BX070DRAFT_31846 [Coemansia spiralis]